MSADIANASVIDSFVSQNRWIFGTLDYISESHNPKEEVRHVRTGKQGKKARRKEKNQEGKKCTSAGISIVAPFDGDHTGSRATEWLTEIDQRRHTCMIDASIYRMADSSSSGMIDKGKVMGR